MKRKGVSTFFICSYLRALNRLAHFENDLCMYLFENAKYDTFVMIFISIKNAYKVFAFENISKKCDCEKKRCL